MDTATLKGLLEKATKGPWRYSHEHEAFGVVWASRVAIADVDCNSRLSDEQRSNAKLIVALRNNAEELIASAERVARLEAALQRIANMNNGPDLASGEWRCTEAAEIARQALGGAK